MPAGIIISPLYARWNMKSEVEIKVRGYHLDIYSHVNNARYLEFLEEGRWAALEDSHAIKNVLERGYAFTVVNINISYRSSATVGDTLIVTTDLLKTGEKSVTVIQKIFRKLDMRLVVEAEVTYVLVDVKTGKAVTLTDEMRDFIINMNPDCSPGKDKTCNSL